MIDSGAAGPLSAETLAHMRRIVADHLATASQSTLPVCWSAIHLAVALDDPELRESVQRFTDWNHVVALGLTDTGLIVQTTTWAADRLAGVPVGPTAR